MRLNFLKITVIILCSALWLQTVHGQEVIDLKVNKPNLSTAKAAVQAGGNRVLLTDVLIDGKGLYDLELVFNSAQGTFVVANGRAKRVSGEFSCIVRQPNFTLQVTYSKNLPTVNLRFTTSDAFTTSPSAYALIQKRRKVQISNNIMGQGKATESAALGNLARREFKVQYGDDFYVQPGVDVDVVLSDVPGWFDFGAPLEGVSMFVSYQLKTFKCE